MKNRRRKKKKSLLKRIFIFLLIVAVAAVALIGARYFINRQKVVKLDEIEMPDWIKSEIIKVDGTSRSGEKLSSVKDIVVHYVGNPGSTAEQNRNFYAGDVYKRQVKIQSNIYKSKRRQELFPVSYFIEKIWRKK